MISPDSDPSRGGLLEPGLRRAFGLDLDPDIWIGRLRGFSRDSQLGRIGSYELLKIAGRGGQGLVYQARQPGTGRIVAIKRLSAGAFSTPEMRARFQREVETAAALTHPHIATAFGSELIDGQPILVMEWVEGVSINRWADGDTAGEDAHNAHEATMASAPPRVTDRRDVREVLRLMIEVCEAIQHAHQRGVIHRDLKPSNILVDANDSPHVLDFGLAKLSKGESDAAHITATGAFLGTPAFASPEQAGGDPREVDVRSDVYSLGAVLYQMITGRMPFPEGGPVSKLLDDIRNREPASPSSIDPRANGEIDSIVLKALAKEKERRYPSVDALAADLRRYLNGEAISAVAPSAAYRLRKLAHRHRIAIFALSAVLVTLSVATAVSISYYLKAAAAGIEVQKKLEASDLANRRKDSLLQFVEDILSQGDPNVSVPADRTIRKALDSARVRFEQNPGQYEAAIAAPLQDTIATLYLSLALPADAAPLAKRSVELYRSLSEEGEDGLCQALCHYGEVLEVMGDLEGAEAALRESISLSDRLHAAYPDRSQGATALLIRVLDKKGAFEDAIRLARERVEILEPFSHQCKEAYAQALNAWALRLPCDPPEYEALPALRKALDACVIAWGRGGVSTTNVRFNYAGKLRVAGRLEEALNEMEEGLAYYHQMPGPDHPNTLRMRMRLADILFELGRVSGAIETARSVIDIEKEKADTDPVQHAMSLYLLGKFLLADTDPASAVEPLRNATAIMEEKMPNSDKGIPAQLVLAHALCLSPEPEQGIRLFTTLIQAIRSRAPNSAHQADALKSYADALIAMARPESALGPLQEAISILRNLNPPSPVKLSACLRSLGESQLMTHQAAEAELSFREAVYLAKSAQPAESPLIVQGLRGLGVALTALHRFADAETVLISAETSLSRDPRFHTDARSQTQKALAELYESWHATEADRGHDERANEWRRKQPSDHGGPPGRAKNVDGPPA